MDRLAPAARSDLMSRIRSKDTTPELVVRRYLHRRGLRFRLHDKTLPGSPDLIFKARKVAIFVHGCFWHGHRRCRLKVRIPKSRPDFWREKIETNRLRDTRAARRLRALGWRVLVVWECRLDNESLATLYDHIVDSA
jgi:DNA mismatch endonuclease, patch repair protein